MRRLKKILIGILVSSLAGCGTFFSKAGDHGQYWGNPYSGVKCSGQMVQVTLSSQTAFVLFPLAVVDVVISAVADTLLLPVDLAITPASETVANPCNLK